MKQAPRRHGKKPASGLSLLERIPPNAAGIDCGAEMHYVAVPADRDPAPVRSFTTFTADLHRLADRLQACGVTTVAMESTGVYWIPLYEILEARGLAVVLVNARHVKHVAARKSDVQDCQWRQELHSVGLLRGSFRPTAAIAALRAYLRHPEERRQHEGPPRPRAPSPRPRSQAITPPAPHAAAPLEPQAQQQRVADSEGEEL
jgi:hypothetical protein